MKLRTNLEPLRFALWSALGITHLVACGGTAVVNGGGAGTSSGGSSGMGVAGSGPSTGGQSTGGQSGAPTAGALGIGGASNRYPCANSQSANNDGFVQCDGFQHREQAQACASHIPRPEPVAHTGAGCNFDADCNEKPYGWCSNFSQGNDAYCVYGCTKDSECPDDTLCECAEPVGRCVPASCKVDAACASGFLCRSFDSTGGCNIIQYGCQSPADTCGSDADCNTAGSTRNHCRFDENAHRFQCAAEACAIGRPFLVQDVQRLALLATHTDWLERAWRPALIDCDETVRAEVAEQWTRIALMEHASVAAFARFTLQLMSQGAPAWLVEQATAAMADETKHAKACFAVASGYAGTPLGPGYLAVEHSLDDASLEAIVRSAIREGCVGETAAAIEAREAAEHVLDPKLRDLLLMIAEDETRHAQLAYSFVKWALEQGGPALERAARREFSALVAEKPVADSALTDTEFALLRHGVVPEALRRSIRSQAISQVILPCSQSLFPVFAHAPQGIRASKTMDCGS